MKPTHSFTLAGMATLVLLSLFLISCSDEETMRDQLDKTGFVTLHINFETGKADIKPESQKVVDQVAELLKSDDSLNVSIEGHTDNVGSAASNKTLSENRAKSVMNAIIASGIEKSRLSAKGWGQEKPVGDNKTEEGRAMNRRVEIVKK
ncbi:MAG: OmpA family protein [bacterium]